MSLHPSTSLARRVQWVPARVWISPNLGVPAVLHRRRRVASSRSESARCSSLLLVRIVAEWVCICRLPGPEISNLSSRSRISAVFDKNKWRRPDDPIKSAA